MMFAWQLTTLCDVMDHLQGLVAYTSLKKWIRRIGALLETANLLFYHHANDKLSKYHDSQLPAMA